MDHEELNAELDTRFPAVERAVREGDGKHAADVIRASGAKNRKIREQLKNRLERWITIQLGRGSGDNLSEVMEEGQWRFENILWRIHMQKGGTFQDYSTKTIRWTLDDLPMIVNNLPKE